MEFAVPAGGGENRDQLMTPSIGRSFLMLNYIVVMLGGALGTGARFWASGIVAERAGEFFLVGTLVVNITGSFLVGFFAAFTGPEGPFLTAISPIFYDRGLWRLHHVFVVQPPDTGSHSGR